ncbi:MAG: DapH/DapD/GlmU-related protein [Candidatus Curtissbacteria bacterium]
MGTKFEGVEIVDSNTTYVDEAAQIGEGTTIFPNTTIMGKTKIGKNCQIGPNTQIVGCEIADDCTVFFSVLKNSKLGKKSDVGPFSHLRGEVELGEGVHVGNYVEMKKTKVGSNTKIGHVTYLGDATIGEDVNIGAGTITANFDGENKNKTVIEDGAFIGCNTVLVAPVRVGKGAKTAAGAVVLHDVEEKSLVAGVPATFKRKLS